MRLANSDSGWKNLLELQLLTKLSHMQLWCHVPDELFVESNDCYSVCARRFISALDCTLCLCLALCANRNGTNNPQLTSQVMDNNY
jgi:hypothetical protein